MGDYTYEEHRQLVCDTVDALVTDILRGRVQNGDELDDWLENDADGETTYLNRALDILSQSSHWDAIDDDGDDIPNNAADAITAMARAAWKAEVRDEFSRVPGQPVWDEYCPECDGGLEYDDDGKEWRCPHRDAHCEEDEEE